MCPVHPEPRDLDGLEELHRQADDCAVPGLRKGFIPEADEKELLRGAALDHVPVGDW